jgi:hypothetical protein
MQVPVRDEVSNEDAAQYLVNPVTGKTVPCKLYVRHESQQQQIDTSTLVYASVLMWSLENVLQPCAALGFFEDLKIPKCKYLLQNAPNR